MPTFKFKNGETITAGSLEEARAMRKAPDAPAPSAPQSVPPWLSVVKMAGGNKKNLDIIKTAQEIAKSESDAKNTPQSAIEDLGKQLARMKQAADEVPTGSGIMSRPSGFFQSIKQKVGLNPALDEYEGLRGNLATQTARKLAGEKGAMAEGDVQRAYSMFPDLPYESTEAAQRKWKAVKDLMEIVVGRPLDDVFKEDQKSPVPFSTTPQGGLAPEKQNRLLELRRKRAEGTLNGANGS